VRVPYVCEWFARSFVPNCTLTVADIFRLFCLYLSFIYIVKARVFADRLLLRRNMLTIGVLSENGRVVSLVSEIDMEARQSVAGHRTLSYRRHLFLSLRAAAQLRPTFTLFLPAIEFA
jgi:hypothetical protein